MRIKTIAEIYTESENKVFLKGISAHFYLTHLIDLLLLFIACTTQIHLLKC